MTCPVCSYKGEHPGRSFFWECSHVECPNRKSLTAGACGEKLHQEENKLFEEKVYDDGESKQP